MTPASEGEIRQQLGIPADAARVILFAESSHWDPDWLYSSDEYYQLSWPNILIRREV